jgi:hypothetical protein
VRITTAKLTGPRVIIGDRRLTDGLDYLKIPSFIIHRVWRTMKKIWSIALPAKNSCLSN